MTGEEIKDWLRSPECWPAADSYNLDSLAPSLPLARREKDLRSEMPEWFWRGEKGSSILSVGAGKLYFERKYWREFDSIYVIDPSDRTRRSLECFPIPNARFVSTSLFDAPLRLTGPPKYCWIGASIHYLFAEFYGWAFLRKLAMLVSDTLIIDGGVFDAQAPQGQYLLEKWTGDELFDTYRRSQFSYKRFLENIKGLWTVVHEWPTPWISDGRRTIILKRNLPPKVERKDLGPIELVVSRTQKFHDNWSVFRTQHGFFKKTTDISPFLIYDALGKLMGWDGFVSWQISKENAFDGFMVRDYGDEEPNKASVSEGLYLALVNWCLPLGLLPSDVAAENIRIHDGTPIWIDVDFLSLGEFDAFLALWATSNIYKQYPSKRHSIGREIYETGQPPGSHAHLSMEALPPIDSADIKLSVRQYPRTIPVDRAFNITVEITNATPHILNSCDPHPVYIAYHWMDKNASAIVVFDGQRTPLIPALRPSATERYEATVRSPERAGKYVLRVTLLQEHVRWFEEPPTMLANDLLIAVHPETNGQIIADV